MLSAKDKELRLQYWIQVRLCLLEFHALPEKQADKAIAKYTRDFPLTSQEPEVEFLYHTSPFSMACEITGKNLSLKERSTRYKQILESTSALRLLRLVPSHEVPSSLIQAFQQAFETKAENSVTVQRKPKDQVRESRTKTGLVKEKGANYPIKTTAAKATKTAAKTKPKAKSRNNTSPKKAT